jgi:NADH:ubiquinone oxidoreductase subunit 5 (subunit L)/multisubunit Na+/H+ antiporter MnhA subunit
MLMNKWGDCALTIGFILTFQLFGTFDLITIFTLTPGVTEHYYNFLFFESHSLTLIGFFFFIAAMGKSAQLGFTPGFLMR